MMRNATPQDFQFINYHVLSEAKNGHFNRALLVPSNRPGWDIDLSSVLAARTRRNGITAYALVWEKDKKPVGFVIMSAGPDNKGNELWMSALSPTQRGSGEGKKMILEILHQFKGKNKKLYARCAPESEAMFHILTTNGFDHVDTGEQGSRNLVYTL